MITRFVKSRWFKVGLLVLLLPLLLIVLGLVFQTIATAADARRYPPPGQLVDVGGYRMHLYCIGERRADTPTVILEASYPATISSWVWIQPQIAAITRVCAYDRAGSGWSDLSPAEPTMGQMTEELHTLLTHSGEPGPYLLVGHSWGGAVTQLFARAYPELVSGLVWIEAAHPDTWARRGLPESTLGGMPPEQAAGIPFLARLGLFRLWPSLRGSWGIVPGLPEQAQAELTAYFNTNKWADFIVAVEQALPLSLAQLRQSGNLGDMPLVIVIGSASEEATDIGRKLQQELGTLSSNSRVYEIDGADHSSLVHEQRFAQQTGDAILELLDAIRLEN